MKGSYKNKIFTMMFLFNMAFSFVALNGCARLNQGSAEGTDAKNKEGKEILVVPDIGGGLPFSSIRWCGNTALLIYGGEFGTEWVDMNGNKVIVSKNSANFPIDCTPDGKWVLYEDRNSAREYRDKEGRTPENIVDEGPGWHGSVMDLYRYDITAGMRQKFAVVRDDSGSLVSPDGSRVLLGNRHDSVIDMPEPKWETVWFTNEWLADERWFADSSGIAALIWHNGHDFGVEFFGEKGWSKEFSLEQFWGSKPGGNISFVAIDKQNRFYFLWRETPLEVKQSGWTKYHFLRCMLKNEELLCEEIGMLDEGGVPFASLELLSDGDVIFKREEDGCIRRLTPGRTDAKCIADTRYGNDIYENIFSLSVSPDGKRMAFRRGKTPPKPGKRFYAYQYDLFVKELSED